MIDKHWNNSKKHVDKLMKYWNIYGKAFELLYVDVDKLMKYWNINGVNSIFVEEVVDKLMKYWNL